MGTMNLSVNLLAAVQLPFCTILSVYASRSNTTSRDNHEEIDSCVSYIFLPVYGHGALLGSPLGHQSSTISQKVSLMKVFILCFSGIYHIP